MAWDFEPVAGPVTFTEGPTWVPDEPAVYFTDIRRGEIHRHDPTTGETEAWRTDTDRGNGLALGPDGAFYCCEMGGQVARYDRDGTRTVLVDSFEGDRLNSPNDLVFDAEGRLWFTDPDYDDQDDLELGHFSVYRLDPADDSAITRVTFDTTNPNGLALSPAEDTLYVAQSEYGEGNPRELRAYGIDDEGVASDYEVIHDFYPHRGVDGMCLDAEGNVVAAAGSAESGPGPKLYVFSPAGEVLETHPYPAEAPTNCCFGGDDLTTVYATGYDGVLYRAETDRTGYEIPP